MLITVSIAAAVAFAIAAPGAALLDRKPARKRAHKPAETVTPYTGPLYTVHGREFA